MGSGKKQIVTDPSTWVMPQARALAGPRHKQRRVTKLQFGNILGWKGAVKLLLEDGPSSGGGAAFRLMTLCCRLQVNSWQPYAVGLLQAVMATELFEWLHFCLCSAPQGSVLAALTVSFCVLH